MITDVKDYMLFAAMDAMRVLSDEFASVAEQELAMKVSYLRIHRWLYDMLTLSNSHDFWYSLISLSSAFDV